MEDSSGEPTTNAADQQAAAALTERLQQQQQQQQQQNNDDATVRRHRPNPVHRWTSHTLIDPGRHKYVLIRAYWNADNNSEEEEEECYFVTSKKGAAYHQEAATALVERLEESGYENLQVLGGGRIDYNPEQQTMKIYGFSYGFGKADHDISRRIVEADAKYRGVAVTTSDEGY